MLNKFVLDYAEKHFFGTHINAVPVSSAYSRTVLFLREISLKKYFKNLRQINLIKFKDTYNDWYWHNEDIFS